MKKEFRNLEFKFNDIDEDKGIIEGYASTFGNVDLGLDIVDKGAFTKTLMESGGKIPILADHDPRKQIGWNHEAEEDDKGLRFKGQLDIENNDDAKKRFSLAKQAKKIGAKFGISIGYITIKAEPDSENPNIRRLKELKLLEYSAVTFPMNTEAMMLNAKSLNLMHDDEFGKVIAKLVKSGKTKNEILNALEKVAQTEVDPQEMQSVLDVFRKTSNIFRH